MADPVIAPFGEFELPGVAPQAPSPAGVVGGAPAPGPAPTPAGPAQGVLNTGMPEAPWDDNADVEAWYGARSEKARRVLSPRGNFRPLDAEVPQVEELMASDPRAQKLPMANEYIAGIGDPKERQKALQVLTRFQTQLRNDAIRARNEKLAALKSTYAVELNKTDPSDSTTQAIQQRVADLRMAADGYKAKMTEVKDNHPNPRERGDAELSLKTAPELLLGTAFDTFAMQIAQKAKIPGPAAYEALVTMTTPLTTPKLKGANGYTGRAATLYDVVGSDPVGNIIVQLPNRMRIFVPPATFDALEDARLKAYDIAKKYNADRAAAQKKSEEPGWVTRQVEKAYNYVVR